MRKKYTNEELFDIYTSIMLDTLETEFPKLYPYRNILDYIINDNKLMFDSLYANDDRERKRNIQQSYRYLQKLINVVTKIPKASIHLVDRDFLRAIYNVGIFKPYPHSSEELDYILTVVTPWEIEESNLKAYLSSFTNFISHLIYYQKEVDFGINNFEEIIGYIYGYHRGYDLWSRYEIVVGLLLAYLYARPLEFSKEDIDYIVHYCFDHIDYFIELYSLQTGYTGDERTFANVDMQYYYRLKDAIDKIKNGQKRLIK